jgi:hypothetical protein
VESATPRDRLGRRFRRSRFDLGRRSEEPAKLQLGRDGASCRAAYTNRFTNASALSQTSRQPLSIVNE